MFASFEFEPVASASVAQVHFAELFDGTHARLTYRYPGAIRELAVALSR